MLPVSMVMNLSLCPMEEEMGIDEKMVMKLGTERGKVH